LETEDCNFWEQEREQQEEEEEEEKEEQGSRFGPESKPNPGNQS